MSEATSRQPSAARRARPASPPGTSAEDPPGSGDSCPAEDDAAAALEAYVAAMVAAAPPLTSEQRDRLALLFHTRRHPVKTQGTHLKDPGLPRTDRQGSRNGKRPGGR
jgi:hypothetical protein